MARTTVKSYLELLEDVMFNGVDTDDRTGTGTLSVFGRQLRFDLSKGFPLITTKKMFTRGIFAELLWFLSGDTNEKTLAAQNVNIWKEWAPKGAELSLQERIELWRTGDYGVCNPAQAENSHEDLDKLGVPRHAEGSGDLGRIYGAQWRKWRSVKMRDASLPERLLDLQTLVPELKSAILIAHYSSNPHTELHELCDRNGVADKKPSRVEIDQITELIKGLKENPGGRRHLVTAWNPGELDQMALPPCHCLFQFHTAALTLEERGRIYDSRHFPSADPADSHYTGDDWHKQFDGSDIPRYRLSCQLYQRSADVFLGVPFNIASYALLTHMVAQQVNMVPGDFVHTFGDLHLYKNHFEQAKLQLSREPHALPTLSLRKADSIFDYKLTDIKIVGYESDAAIKADVSV
jgi:thymidylate synthase